MNLFCSLAHLITYVRDTGHETILLSVILKSHLNFRTIKKLPRRLLSSDGQHVLNIWFIPHHLEVLVMYKTLDDSACCRALAYSLSIVGNLHDILQYLSVQAHLSSSQIRTSTSNKTGSVSVGRDGADGIGKMTASYK